MSEQSASNALREYISSRTEKIRNPGVGWVADERSVKLLKEFEEIGLDIERIERILGMKFSISKNRKGTPGEVFGFELRWQMRGYDNTFVSVILRPMFLGSPDLPWVIGCDIVGDLLDISFEDVIESVEYKRDRVIITGRDINPEGSHNQPHRFWFSVTSAYLKVKFPNHHVPNFFKQSINLPLLPLEKDYPSQPVDLKENFL